MLFNYSANNHDHKFDIITADYEDLELIFYRLNYAEIYGYNKEIKEWREKYFKGGYKYLKCGNDSATLNELNKFREFHLKKLKKEYHHWDCKDRKQPYITGLCFYTLGRGYGFEYEFTFKGLEDSGDRKSTRLNSSHIPLSRMPSSA